MSGPGCFTFLLLALSCYALSTSKAIGDANTDSSSRKLDLLNHLEQEQHRTLHGSVSGVGGNVGRSGVIEEARQKRSQHEGGEFSLNDIGEDHEDAIGNSALQAAMTASMPQLAADWENMPPVTYYLLLQKLRQLQANEPTYRVRTPRLGRSIDFQLLDAVTGGGGVAAARAAAAAAAANSLAESGLEEFDNGNYGGVGIGLPHALVSRIIKKKSVPFKPRLGKRGPQCE